MNIKLNYLKGMGAMKRFTKMFFKKSKKSASQLVIHSPTYTHGKETKWTTRIITNTNDWKKNMQLYLQDIFRQLFSYDEQCLGYVGDKYLRTIKYGGTINRTMHSGIRHNNALFEIQKIFSPNNHFDIMHLTTLSVYLNTLNLLDVYYEQKRIEDFEEIVYIMTIIINYPYILKTVTLYD